MVHFAIRVELHGEPYDGEKYKRLHQAMESRGFKRIVTASDGKRYHLPPAEYIYDYPAATLAAVTNMVTRTAESIGKSTIMVHEADDWRGTNLKPAV